MGLQELREQIESGVGLGAPDGILFNGFGPYRYDNTLVPDGISYQIINVEPGDEFSLHSSIVLLLTVRKILHIWQN